MVRRWKILGVSLAVIMGLLAVRAGYIQILGHEELSAAAELQQRITLEGADKRGAIYDRNGTPLAGANQEYIYIIEDENFDGETQNALNSLYAAEVDNEGNGYRVFTSEIYRKSIAQRLVRNSGAMILEANRRYQEEQPAVHMIGYVNPGDNSGASGLELQYNSELSMLDKKVSAVADIQGHLLQGYGLEVTRASDEDEYIKQGITTTLEMGIQRAAEDALNGCGKDGAVIVAACKTGEILAAASTPVFDPGNVEEYVNSDNGELINKVTQGEYPPGSIFKIVVAAAALENGMEPSEQFICNGSEKINGHVIKCDTGGDSGHGRITMEEAFAYSCNCAFIQIGQKIGAEKIISTAKILGMGTSVFEDYPEERKGNLMTIEQSQGAAIANLSIGQGEMLATPLQIAAMTSIIANDGVDCGTYLIKEDEGNAGENRCISAGTAHEIKQMMEAAAEYGTGKDLEIDIPAAVKTGSAEGTQSGIQVVHGWITGYVPADDPEYVITVFVEDGRSGRTSAGPVFAQIVSYLEEKGMTGYTAGL